MNNVLFYFPRPLSTRSAAMRLKDKYVNKDVHEYTSFAVAQRGVRAAVIKELYGYVSDAPQLPLPGAHTLKNQSS